MLDTLHRALSPAHSVIMDGWASRKLTQSMIWLQSCESRYAPFVFQFLRRGLQKKHKWLHYMPLVFETRGIQDGSPVVFEFDCEGLVGGKSSGRASAAVTIKSSTDFKRRGSISTRLYLMAESGFNIR